MSLENGQTTVPRGVETGVYGDGTGLRETRKAHCPLIANALHQASARKDGPIITINCGAIPETLIDSALFGHEKGAFTGAASQKRGRFYGIVSGSWVCRSAVQRISRNLPALWGSLTSSDAPRKTHSRRSLSTFGAFQALAQVGRARQVLRRHPHICCATARYESPSGCRNHPTTPRPAR
jgi:hypothetical protein